MASLNKVFLIGNLTRDPELRYTAGGTPVGDLSIAVSQKFVSKATGEQRNDVVFANITVWGKQAEACGEYLTKGSSLFVEGRLQFDSWEGKDGQKRNRLRVVAQRIQFMGRPKTAKSGVAVKAGSENISQEIPAENVLEDAENPGGDEVPPEEGGESVPF